MVIKATTSTNLGAVADLDFIHCESNKAFKNTMKNEQNENEFAYQSPRHW